MTVQHVALDARKDIESLRQRLWLIIASGDYAEEDLSAYRSLDTAALAVARLANSGDPRAPRKIESRWRTARRKALGCLNRRLFS